MRPKRGNPLALLLIAVGVIVLFFSLSIARASIGTLRVYKGDAEITHNGQKTNSANGKEVFIKDSLKIAPDSTVAIALKDSSVIRLEAGSEVEIAELSYEGNKIKNAAFKLKTGRLWSRVAPLDKDSHFEVETPTAVAAVAGTSYNTTYRPEITGVYTYKRVVRVSLIHDSAKSTAVKAGELLQMRNSSLQEDFNTGVKPPPDEFFDDWIRFNQAEDDKICREAPTTPGCEEESTNSPSPSSNTETVTTSTPTDQPTSQLLRNSFTTLSPSKTPSKKPTPTRQSTSDTSSGGTIAPTPTPTPKPEKKLTSLSLSSSKSQLNLQDKAILKVVATYSDKSTQDISTLASYTQNPSLGTLTGNIFTATKVGTTTIQSNYQGIKSNTLTLAIVRKLTSITVSYSIPNSDIRAAQFKATAVYDDRSTQDVTKSATWSLRQPSSATISSSGYYTPGRSQGDRVYGSFGGVTGFSDIAI